MLSESTEKIVVVMVFMMLVVLAFISYKVGYDLGREKMRNIELPKQHINYEDFVQGIEIGEIIVLEKRGISNSMGTSLPPSAAIFMKKVITADELSIGDIIVYSEQDYLISHRIVFMNETHLITKGDRNPDRDESITFERIEGLVVGVLY